MNHHHPIATTTTSTSTYNYHYHRPPLYNASCTSTSGICAPVGGRKKTTSASCNRWHHHWCKECLHQWLKEKHHQRKLQPMTATMCASGVLTLAERKIRPQVQVQRSGHKVQRSGQKVERSGPASAQVGKGCSSNIQLQPPSLPLARTKQHDAAITATCVKLCKEFVPLCKLQ